MLETRPPSYRGFFLPHAPREIISLHGVLLVCDHLSPPIGRIVHVLHARNGLPFEEITVGVWPCLLISQRDRNGNGVAPHQPTTRTVDPLGTPVKRLALEPAFVGALVHSLALIGK
ncbi:hypothetical protein BS47DRAFT_1352291 [Hydnum rufescens UP504]|uniref:Uncharacterized protein n=1 Tax=Hydnum rufescens UP504 TaxID=1448309 RepID=A0A9P6DLI4_9AGAM|nr:hypothetical protein BS47DRAFT_1352291 [Hydnum rufescens UP504]